MSEQNAETCVLYEYLGGIVEESPDDVSGSYELVRGFYVESISTTHGASLIGTPVETGETRFDNKVLQPEYVTVVGYYHWRDEDDDSAKVHDVLQRIYEQREYRFCAVKSRTNSGEGLHINLMMENYTEREDPEKFDLVQVTINFKQIILTKVSDRNSANEDDATEVSG